MNILIETVQSPYSGDRIGGVETSLRLIAEKLVERGHSVVFITHQQTPTHYGFSRERINGVDVITYSNFKFNLLNKYKFYHITGFFKDLYQKNIIKKRRLQIVYTYYNYRLMQKFVRFKKNSNFKLVIRIAGLRVFEDIAFKGKIRQKGYEDVFKEVDNFNFISSGIFELFHLKMKECNFEYQFQNYFIHDIGVDLNQKVHRNPIEVKTKFKIAMVSRFSDYQKRQDLLIDAIAQLNNPNIHLILIGEGKEEEKLRQQVKALNVSENVSFEPFIKSENLWKHLQQFDMLVHACDYEGMSKIIVESMAYGLPVLASDVSPINTYIQDGETGFLVENQADSWTKKIQYVYDKQELLPEIIKNARDFAIKNFDADKNIAVYENAFREVLNQNV